MRPRRPAVSTTELEVLKVLWEHGPATVRDVDKILCRRGRCWAYTTVLTLLRRLQAKGYVRSDKSGMAHVFRPAVSRDRMLRQGLRDLAEKLCEGTATPLVAALVKGYRFSAEEARQLRELLAGLDQKETD